MARVMMCTPHADTVRPMFYRHLIQMQIDNPEHIWTYGEVETYVVHKARTMLVGLARQFGADVAMWIDNDVLVPANAGTLVDKALETGIASGVYYARRSPYTPQVFERIKEGDNAGLYRAMVPLDVNGEPFTADAVGFGCVAVRMDVFDRMDEIFLEQHQRAAALLDEFPLVQQSVERLSPHFEFLDRKGEDFYFCEHALEAGYEIWVDPKIQCIHVGDIGIIHSHFQHIYDNGLFVDETVESNLDAATHQEKLQMAIEINAEGIDSKEAEQIIEEGLEKDLGLWGDNKDELRGEPDA